MNNVTNPKMVTAQSNRVSEVEFYVQANKGRRIWMKVGSQVFKWTSKGWKEFSYIPADAQVISESEALAYLQNKQYAHVANLLINGGRVVDYGEYSIKKRIDVHPNVIIKGSIDLAENIDRVKALVVKGNFAEEEVIDLAA